MSRSNHDPHHLSDPLKVAAETINTTPVAASLPTSASAPDSASAQPSVPPPPPSATSIDPTPLSSNSARSSRSLTHVDSEEEAEVEIVGADEQGNEKATKVKRRKKEVVLQDQTNLLPVRQVIVVFAGLSLSLFCCLLDQTIISTALPSIGQVFGASTTSSWVANAYLLTSTAIQPLYGRFSDIFGRKQVLIFALTVFFLGDLACALSTSMIMLIVFRALAGVGGGGILSLVMIIISDVVSLKDRGKYQGVTGVVVVVSNSLGPLLGGILTQKLTWRWCFWINLPLIAVTALIVFFLLPLKHVTGGWRQKTKQIDYYGSIITLGGTIAILIPVSWGGIQHPWSSASVIAPLVIGILSIGLFILVELKVALPIIPMSMFRYITVTGVMASTFLSGCVFYAQLYYLPQYFQVVLQVSSIRSGVLLFALILPQTVFSFASGYIVSLTGEYRYSLCIGFTVWTIGLGLLSSLNETSGLGKIIGYQFLAGAGAGQTFQTGLIAAQAAVPRPQMAVVTSTRNFVRLLGGTLSLAICQSLLNNAVRSSLASSPLISSSLISEITASPTTLIRTLPLDQRALVIHAYVKGVQHVWYFCIPCAGISLFLAVFCIKHHSLTRDDDKDQKAKAKEWARERKEKHAKGDEEKGKHKAARGEEERGTKPEP